MYHFRKVSSAPNLRDLDIHYLVYFVAFDGAARHVAYFLKRDDAKTCCETMNATLTVEVK